MKILIGSLLLPLLISARTANDSAEEALNLFLKDGTWFNFRTQTECNGNSYYNGGIKPDHGIEDQMSKLDPNNLTITRATYINEAENLILFFVPEVSRFFTATKQTKYIVSSEFQLTNDQYHCAALGIAQHNHQKLARFRIKKWKNTSFLGFLTTYTYAEKWYASFLHDPLTYHQQNGQPEKTFFKNNCTDDDAALIERATNDQILGASFVKGSDFKKIKYTAVTWDRELRKYGMITEFTLEEFGADYEYVHMKDLGIML